MMKFRVETLPNYRVAYVRKVGPYGSGNLEVWEKLKQWANDRQLLNSTTILLAVQQDNPETTLPQNCRFDACIVIPKDFQIDESITESEISGATIFPSIQNNGYQIDNKPIFERYIGDMNHNHYWEICVPVKPS